MAEAMYHSGFFTIPESDHLGWIVEAANDFKSGTFRIVGSGGIRIYLYPEHLRMLRDAITQALGEQPQDTSALEQIASLQRVAWDAIDTIGDVVKNACRDKPLATPTYIPQP